MTPMPLAMHMANELLSLPVAVATLLLAAAAVALAGRRVRLTVDPSRLPLMGVFGAFVFAAQMINFSLPLMPGTSGHLGGAVLLAILLGPSAAIITMTGILIVQCLLFQDGGMLALGCNIINMGIVPSILGWSAYRLLLGKSPRAGAWRQYLAAWAACMIGITAGAAIVPVEAAVSGVLRVPMLDFMGVMVGVHLLIGFVEGLITFAVLAYLRRARPALVGLEVNDADTSPRGRLGRLPVTASFLMTAALLAGVVSWFASTHPDGLEWCYRGHDYGQTGQAIANESPWIAKARDFQGRFSLMPDYSKRQAPVGAAAPAGGDQSAAPQQAQLANVSGWGSLAGLLGTAATLAMLLLAAKAMRKRTPRTRAP